MIEIVLPSNVSLITVVIADDFHRTAKLTQSNGKAEHSDKEKENARKCATINIVTRSLLCVPALRANEEQCAANVNEVSRENAYAKRDLSCVRKTASETNTKA